LTGPAIAVTGATGFIGRHLCVRLLESGYRVRILARNPLMSRPLVSRGASLVGGDLGDARALQKLVSGCSVVIHAAGAVRGNSQQAFDTVNVAGTSGLLDAVNTQDFPPRLLLISSLAAREPGLSWYARSKREAEERLQRVSKLDWVILRPPAVYGPGDREMLPVFQLMSRGIALVPGPSTARVSLIHVDDLTEAILRCIATPATRGQLLTACDGKPGGYDWLELSAIAGSVWSRPVRPLEVPSRLLDYLARMNVGVSRVTGRAAMLTPAKLRELRHPDWVTDNRVITETTGWLPKIGLHEGLNDLQIRAK
jgi:nucleoside-diphosphate-sugar epimerase